MQDSAINAIADLSAANKAASMIVNSGVEAIIVPNGYKLEDLERFRPEPNLFRGKFNTTILAQFINYVDDNATVRSGVFIDQQNMQAEAIIDMGFHDTPQWGKHRASVTLERTPAYAALIRSSEQRINQQNFIDFAEDWQDNISFYYDDNSFVTIKEAITALRKLKTSATSTSESEVGNFAVNRSAMESIEVSAGAKQPPSGFHFRTIPYDGFDEITFDCQLRAMPDAKEVFLKFRINQFAQHQEKTAEQFRDKIQSGITVDNISIFIGDMKYQE